VVALAELEAARQTIDALERRLGESEAMVKALLVGNLDTLLAGVRAGGAIDAVVEGALLQGLADRSAVIDQLPCGVVVYDERGRLLFANPAAAELSGDRRDPRVLPTQSLDLAPVDPAAGRPVAASDLPVPRALAGEQVHQFECVLRDPLSREDRALRVSAVPRLDGAGQTIGAICTIIDVSERARLQRELLQSDRMACVGTLAAGMAHEINNPLAYILANIAFVADEVPALVRQLRAGSGGGATRTEEIDRALGDARDGAERIRRVVSELKAFARADDDARQPLDVRVPIEEACQVAETELRHRARLVKDLAAVPRVMASDSGLRQLFLNLLMNAAQAVEEAADDAREIRVTTRTFTGADVVVEVSDSGPGIPSASLPRVFDPFFSLRPAGSTAGFGLATCESIALGHGGTISVESEVGRGTVFRVTLPATATLPTARPAERDTRQLRGKVLVIDDELAVTDSIKRVLGRDHDVVAVLQAAEAFDMLSRGDDFDLVLCDVMMPGMGGLDLYAKLAAVRPEVLPRIAFMTGGAFTARARAFLESVPNPRMSKPFDLAELRAFVSERIVLARDPNAG
jgi:signal transduction histidine kinase/CheY-like chemotaxis protein